MSFIIEKVAFALPKNSYSNEEFIKKFNVNSTADWILQRTGFQKRHFIEDMHEFEEIITKCAKQVWNECVQGIIVASSTNFYKFPGLAQIVHHNLNAKCEVQTLDINAACNGFVQALSIARSWLNDGMESVIVIGADAMSSILDFSNRETCCLFGDAAGAVLISKSLNYKSSAVSFTCSKNYQTLIAKEYIKMNGRYVFEESINYFNKAIDAVLEKANIELEEVDYFILHQANYRILKYFAQKKGIDEKKVPFCATNWANVSAATIPGVLNELDYKGKTLVFAGFGAGFTASAIVLSCFSES